MIESNMIETNEQKIDRLALDRDVLLSERDEARAMFYEEKARRVRAESEVARLTLELRGAARIQELLDAMHEIRGLAIDASDKFLDVRL